MHATSYYDTLVTRAGDIFRHSKIKQCNTNLSLAFAYFTMIHDTYVPCVTYCKYPCNKSTWGAPQPPAGIVEDTPPVSLSFT